MLIIWDYFGVIAQDSFWYTAVQIAEGKGMGDDVKALQKKADLGQISWDDYTLAVSKDIDVPVSEVRDRYQQHNIKQQNIMAIKNLPEHTHVLLSNASHTYLLPIMERLGLNSLFTRIFVSSELGFAKPDERAFNAVLQEMHFEAKDAVMIDDSARNIDAAIMLGMKGIVFDENIEVETELNGIVLSPKS